MHGIVFAIKQASPSLYAEFASTLGLAERTPPPFSTSSASHVSEKVARQMASLASPAALPVSLIVHGDVRVASAAFRGRRHRRPGHGQAARPRQVGLIPS